MTFKTFYKLDGIDICAWLLICCDVRCSAVQYSDSPNADSHTQTGFDGLEFHNFFFFLKGKLKKYYSWQPHML